MKAYKTVIFCILSTLMLIPSLNMMENGLLSSAACNNVFYSTVPNTEITIKDILNKHIPKPLEAVLHSDSLEFKGRLKKDVMPWLTGEMKKMGWKEITSERRGSMQYFVKEINRRHIKISVVPAQRGGPEEENISTFVYFKIVPPNTNR